jgi:hypothetical protein
MDKQYSEIFNYMRKSSSKYRLTNKHNLDNISNKTFVANISDETFVANILIEFHLGR